MNILVQYPELDACAFYRTVGPYGAIKHHNVIFNRNPHYGEIRHADVFVMQRPFTTDLLMLCKEAKDYDTKLVVDFDDDFFNIPKDNPVHSLYTEENLKNVQMALQLADLVTVSTKHLRREYAKYNENIVVIPNAIDNVLIKFRDATPSLTRVLWRGTRTHDRDVATVAKEIIGAASQFPDFEFTFLGSDPCSWALSEHIKNVKRILTPMSPFMFYQTEIMLKPRIMIAPLSDNTFNRSKSNIAALEGALAGAVTIAPDWEEWRIPGVQTYKKPSEFELILCKLLKDPKACEEHAKTTWDFILNNLTLEQTNKLRVKALEDLLN